MEEEKFYIKVIVLSSGTETKYMWRKWKNTGNSQETRSENRDKILAKNVRI